MAERVVSAAVPRGYAGAYATSFATVRPSGGRLSARLVDQPESDMLAVDERRFRVRA